MVTYVDDIDTSQLNIVTTSLPPGWTVTQDPPAGGLTRVTITSVALNGGDTFGGTIRVQIRTNTTINPTITNPGTGGVAEVTGPDVENGTQSDSHTINVNLPTVQWQGRVQLVEWRMANGEWMLDVG